jgi:ATP-dependent DNA helicase RecG
VKYFSAISNEANLKGLQYGWLIFGVNNKTKAVVGSDCRNTRGLETLKHEIAQDTTGNMSFIDICGKSNTPAFITSHQKSARRV